jgi:hypothetical protein
LVSPQPLFLSFVLIQTPWNPYHLVTLLSKFVDFDSCPAENRDLFPEGYHPHLRLYFSPRLVPGEEAEISFPYPELGQGERLYAPFMAGAETIFARIIERERGKDDGSASRPQDNQRNSNGQFPGRWPSNDNRDGNRNENAGGDRRDENDHHDENHNRVDGRRNENDHHFDSNTAIRRRTIGIARTRTIGRTTIGMMATTTREKKTTITKTGTTAIVRTGMITIAWMTTRTDGDNHNRKDRNGHNRMDENSRDRMDENNRNRKDENDHNGMHHGNNFNTNRNVASSGFSTHFDGNNNHRFFAEIPRDLATKGSIFIALVKGRDNIGEVRLNEESTVAGPVFANFPFDAWSNPISH